MVAVHKGRGDHGRGRGGRVSDGGEQTSLELEGAEPVLQERRKRRRRGSIELLPSGAVRVRVRAIRLPDGRVVELSKTVTEGSSVEWRLKEAQRVRMALEVRALDLECGRAHFDAGITLAECVVALRKGHHLPWRKADDSLWARLRPLWQVPLASIDDARIAGLLRKLAAEGYAATYQRSVFTLLRRALGVAVSRGMLARVPPIRRGTLPPEKARKNSKGLEPEHKIAVFEAARRLDVDNGGDLSLRCALQLECGLRPLECAWARVEELREEDGAWWLYPRRAKGSGLRDGQGVDRVRVPDHVARAVLARVDAMPPRARALGLLFPQPMPRSLWRPRFVERGRHRAAPHWITQSEVAAIRRLSAVDFRPYALRHTRMHELARAGASQWQLQQFGAWQSPRMVAVYAGRVRDEHPAMLVPSAPIPGGSPIKGIPQKSVGAGKRSESLEGSGPHVSAVGSPVGGGGHGPAVGGERSGYPAALWAAASDVERLELEGKGAAVLDYAAEWASPRAAAASLVRANGMAAVRAALEDLRVLHAGGGLAHRAGELAGFIAALEVRSADRGKLMGPKKGPTDPKKATILRVVGAPAGNCVTVIDDRDTENDFAPGNKMEK